MLQYGSNKVQLGTDGVHQKRGYLPFFFFWSDFHILLRNIFILNNSTKIVYIIQICVGRYIYIYTQMLSLTHTHKICLSESNPIILKP